MRLLVPALIAIAAPLAAQPAPAPPSNLPRPVPVESYYRIRWGSFWDFMEIYREHHAPVLAEMQRLGFITSVRTETPVMHMAGDQRWDLRVTITYRDPGAASGSDPAYDRAAQEASRRLFADQDAHLAAETRRFAMIEEHWDLIVAPHTE
ncbi:MAG: hypothetical protein ACXWU1_08385 [Allosphingosinicella sp.]